jgi:hypothetical protein
VGDTSSSSVPSGIVDNTSVVSWAIPLDAASGIVGNTESVLLVDGLQAGLRDRMNDTRPPSASLLGDALAGTPARGTAVEGERATVPNSQAEPTFEALWRAYDYARGKKEAKAAWKALPDDIELAEVIEAAAAWQASWAAQGKPDAPRKHLATWLRDECYDEDAPTGYVKPEKASKAKPSSPERSGRATIPAKASHAFAEGETRLTIVKADVVKGAASATLDILASDEDGMEYVHKVVIEHHDYETQADGQREKDQIIEAAGRYFGIEDSSELIGCEIVAVAEGSKVKFVAPLERKPKPAAVGPSPPTTQAAPPQQAPASYYSATDAYIARMEADLEDKMRGRKPPRARAILQPEPVVVDDDQRPAPPTCRWVSAEIVDSDKEEDTITLWFHTTGKQRTVIHEFVFDEDGQRELAVICKACGLTEISDTEELHGIPLKIETDGENVWGFSPADEWPTEEAA